MSIARVTLSLLLGVILVLLGFVLETAPALAEWAEPNTEDAPAILGLFVVVTILTLGFIGILYSVGILKHNGGSISPLIQVKPGTKQSASIPQVKPLSKKIGKVDLSQGSLVVGLLPDYEPTPLFKRGSRLPLSRKMLFTTTTENQMKMDVHFLLSTTDNYRSGIPLATPVLSNIEPAPKGIPQIEVTVSIDQSGDVYVSAIDKRTAQLIEHETYFSVSEHSGQTKLDL